MSARTVTRFVQHAMALAEREGRPATCEYCQRVVTLDVGASAHSRATADHRTPRARGGAHRWSNLALACGYCNRVKGPLTADEFLAVRTNRRELRLAVAEWTRRLQADNTPPVVVYASRADRRKARIERRMQRLAPRLRTPHINGRISA